MTNELDPSIDQWYVHPVKGEMFRIVATDAATGNVEIQYIGGGVEEIERETWNGFGIEAAESPNEWRVSRAFHRPAARVLQQRPADIGLEVKEEVRLLWRVIDTFGNVSWPPGLVKLH
jgi:hypothetical protein